MFGGNMDLMNFTLGAWTNVLMLHPWLLPLMIAWTLPWKGVALWKAAKRSDKVWFIMLLLINTLGILEIVYIFLISKKPDGAAVTMPRP